jgi:phosphoglycerate dehydrogenase-like enzyme
MPADPSSISSAKPTAGLLYSPDNDAIFFSDADKATLRQLLDLRTAILTADDIRDGRARDLEILISGWGAPVLTAEILDALPAVRIVFHVGGSVKSLTGSGELFARGIRLSSTNPALAQCVAEFCFAQVILASRHVPQNMHQLRASRSYPDTRSNPANFPLTVGLIGYGAIAKALRNMLRQLPLNVLVHDPYLAPQQAADDDVKPVDLMDLFRSADIVSCHLPHLPSTEAMLRGKHFAAMKPQATFLNTARGQVVHELECIEVLKARPDLWAVLDVVASEPISRHHPFHDMHNVLLTPHIAGCTGPECRRLGHFAVNEIRRWLNNQPMLGEVLQPHLALQA